MPEVPARWVIPGSAAAPRGLAHNLLVAVPTLPYPPVWGFGQRAFQLARHLAATHRVTIVAYANPDQRPDVEAMSAFVHYVVAVPMPPDTVARRRLRQLRQVASTLPFHAAALRTREFQAAVDEVLASQPVDAVILESSQMGWLTLPQRVPVIVDEHNIESELLGRMAESEHSLVRRSYNRLEFVRYRRFEGHVWSRAAGCAATSSRDAAAVQERQPDLPTAVVPNGVDPDQFTPADGGAEIPGRLVFTGLLDYRPNLDGITWFLDEVLPLVLLQREAVQVQIVGQGAAETLESLRRPHVEVTGRVPDLTVPMAEAAVVVVPLRIGGGTRLKVVEAMSMGKAIVSTKLGAEGIDVISDRDLLLADDPQSFADAVVRLLDDPQARQRLGASARHLAVDRYSWQRSTDELSDLLDQVLDRAPSAKEDR